MIDPKQMGAAARQVAMQKLKTQGPPAASSPADMDADADANAEMLACPACGHEGPEEEFRAPAPDAPPADEGF